MASPATPLSERSSTWLLLRMTGFAIPGAVQRLPNVPMQQTVAPRSFAFAPEVPTLTGAVWANCSSLGKTWDGVGVGGGVLEPPPPPHPAATISIIKPNNKPEILLIAIRLWLQIRCAKKQSVNQKFYAPCWPSARVTAHA